MNRNRDKGLRAERAVAAYLRANGHRYARRALAGPASDVGDIEGTAAVWEVRNRRVVALPAWLAQLDDKVTRAGATCGFLVVKPAGLGLTRVGGWPVVMRPETWERLTRWLPPGYPATVTIDARARLDPPAVLALLARTRVEHLAWVAGARLRLRLGMEVAVTTLETVACLLPPHRTHDEYATTHGGTR